MNWEMFSKWDRTFFTWIPLPLFPWTRMQRSSTIPRRLHIDRLDSLSLSSSYLSKAGYDNMQKIIDRSGPLNKFTFVCGSDSYFTEPKAVLEVLIRNQSDMTELIISGSLTRSWVSEFQDHSLSRAYLPKMTSYQLLSDGCYMGDVEGHWIRFMMKGHYGVQPLTKIRLCNVILAVRVWRILIRDMEKAMLDELDLEGSSITEKQALELLSGFNSQSRLKRLNLKSTKIGPHFKATTDLSTFNFEIEVDPLPLPTPPPQPQPEYSPPKETAFIPLEFNRVDPRS